MIVNDAGGASPAAGVLQNNTGGEFGGWSPITELMGGILPGIGQMGANRIARDNLAMQQEQYGYQKDLQQRIFAREDNSVQRRVADLKAAGLSPILAAGQGARAGAPVPTSAPQRSTKPQEMLQGVGHSVRELGLTAAQTALTLAQTQRAREEGGRIAEQRPAQLKSVQAAAGLASRSMEAAIEQVQQQAGILRMQREEIVFTAAEKARIDRRLLQDFEVYLEGVVGPYKARNPQVVDFLLNKALLGVREADADFARAMKGTDIGVKVLNLVIRGLLRK